MTSSNQSTPPAAGEAAHTFTPIYFARFDDLTEGHQLWLQVSPSDNHGRARSLFIADFGNGPDSAANLESAVRACNSHAEKENMIEGLEISCARLKLQNAALVAALEEIAEGKGPFSRDPLTHASNTIDAMKAIASAALSAAKGGAS